MLYIQTATSRTPALVIYLIDALRFMDNPCGSTTKIEVVSKAIRETIQEMVRRSMRDGVVHPLYKIAIFAYHTKVEDVLGGICDLPDPLKHGVPPITASGETDTIAGFMAVETLLQNHLKKLTA